jgi:hypothetical protein
MASMAVSTEAPELPHLGGEPDYPGGHPLHTGWLIWHDKKARGGGGAGVNGGQAVRAKDDAFPRLLGRFNTVETFWQYARAAPCSRSARAARAPHGIKHAVPCCAVPRFATAASRARGR